MTITKTVEIPENRLLTIEVPREVPTGTTSVVIQFPMAEPPFNTIKSFRGILKDRGITLERFREMQREDKALEESLPRESDICNLRSS
jgi:hypothetical protein